MSQVAASLGYTSLAGAGAAPRILVVDDEPYMCDVCTRTLQRGGYQVTFQRVQVQDQVLSGVPAANTLNQVAAAGDGDILAITGTRAISYDDIPALGCRRS